VRVHFDVLGWLHISAGVVGVLTGASLFVLAIGMGLALSNRATSASIVPPPAWLLFVAGLVFLAAGVITYLVGRALVTRRPRARPAALALAIPSLVVVPFGTALAVYSFWALLNDDARREYGDATLRRTSRIAE
jgi:hypothetical protein